MSTDLVETAVEGHRQAEASLHSLMLFMSDPDTLFDLLKPAFAEGAPHARARAICRRWQKAIEATL